MIIVNNTKHIGRSVTIVGNKVIVDGKDVTPDSKSINIVVEGSIDSLEVDYCNSIQIKGGCGTVKSSSGDVEIGGNANGPITTSSGDVTIKGDVAGDINTSSGDVECGKVSGNVKTMSGDIDHR